MTNATLAPAPRFTNRLLIGLALVFVIGFAIAAYIDWRWWHPSSQLATFAGIILSVGLGVAFLLVRRLPALVRLAPFALAAGLVAGVTLGPSRPTPINHSADLVLRLTSPIEAEVTAAGTCSTVPAGDQLFVSDDASFAVGEGAEGVHITVAVRSGDMWESRYVGPGGVAFSLRSSPNVIPAGAEDAGETEMVATERSTLTADVEGLEGSVTFAGLEAAEYGSGAVNGPAIAYEGTLEWTCEP